MISIAAEWKFDNEYLTVTSSGTALTIFYREIMILIQRNHHASGEDAEIKEDKKMRVVLCGDLLFSSRNLKQRLDPAVVKILQEADAVFCNAEFSTPKRDTPPGTCMYLTSVPQDILDEFTDLNIRLISFANNHTGDYGWQGCLETIEAAEERKLIPCGVGRNLADARKARFLDTPEGRVAVVTADSTWADRALASVAGTEVVARPGLAPLRWEHTFVLPDKEFEELRAIDAMLGTQESMKEVSRVETWELPDENHFKFGSAMEGYLPVKRGEKAEVRTCANAEDEAAMLKSIRDAARRSDLVIASLHSHEGMNEDWYASVPPTFVEEYAHKAIDAGADVFVGHGAHFSRGVEIYKGHPIFYNLGSLIMEFEAGESMVTPEMYHTYGLPIDSCPSDLHNKRAKKPDGSWNGFYAERRFSLNYLVVMDIDGDDIQYTLVPLDLDMNRENCLERGLPVIPGSEGTQEVAEHLTAMSEKYETKIVPEEAGRMKIDSL